MERGRTRARLYSRSRSRSRSTGRTTQSQSQLSQAVATVAARRRNSYSLSRSLVSPFTVYRFVRRSEQQFGYNGYNGLTNTTGAITYGNGVGLKFSLAGPTLYGNVSGSQVLNALPSYSEFVNLFDDYRLASVKVTFFYSNNVFNQGGTTIPTTIGAGLPMILLCFDEDDCNAPTSNTSLDQRPECRTIQLDTNGPKTFTIRPKAATYVAAGGVSTQGAVPSNRLWMNTATPGVDYFGIKMWFTPWGAAANATQCGYIQAVFEHTFEFRGVQ